MYNVLPYAPGPSQDSFTFINIYNTRFRPSVDQSHDPMDRRSGEGGLPSLPQITGKETFNDLVHKLARSEHEEMMLSGLQV